MPRTPSIRDHLEQDAWRRYPHFASDFSHGRSPRPVQSRRSLHWQDRALLILASVLLALLLLRVETAAAQPGEEPFWGIEQPASGGRQVALATAIRADVTGLAARITVSQLFRNDGTAWREAIYRFPLPDGAAVDRFTIRAGQRVIEGEIREKQDARRQYAQARGEGRLASLVEQQRPNQFETRLANIGPGEQVSVELGFLVPIDYRNGEYSLALPMTFTPRYDPPTSRGTSPATSPASPAGPAFPEAAPQLLFTRLGGDAGHRLAIEINLHSGAALASLESRYHDIDVQPTADGYRVTLADPDARSDRVFALAWRPELGAMPSASLLTWDAGDAVYAQLMVAPPLPEALAPRPREVVFVIDTSGSMAGEGLRQAQAALHAGLGFLGPDDRFNLLRFASSAESLFDRSVPSDRGHLRQADGYIESLRADGGTNMAAAFSLALSMPPQDGLLRQIVFVTDGSVGNEGELLLQIGEHLGDSRLFTVSIGSAPNSQFMRKTANIGRGSHTHIGRQEEVGERMAALWAHIENPAVENLCVDWGMDAEFYPEIIPDLYAGEPLWLYARLPFEPREITLCGEIDGRPWEAVSPVQSVTGGEAIGTLWARSKIEALEDSRLFGVDAALLRQQVLGLALDFGLLTPYTSLVAVDRTPVRPAAAVLGSEDVPSLLPAGTTMNATGFAQTATGWQLRLTLALLSLSLATGMLFFPRSLRPRPAGGARQPGSARLL